MYNICFTSCACAVLIHGCLVGDVFQADCGAFRSERFKFGVFRAPRCIFLFLMTPSPSCSSELREMINYHSALELIRGLISQLIALLSTLPSRARQSDGRRRLVDV